MAIPGVGPFVSAGMRTAGGILDSRGFAGTTGSLVGGYLGKQASKPSAEADQAQKLLLGTNERATNLIGEYGEYGPKFLNMAGEGVNRGRYYLDEAGRSARDVPEFIGSAEDQFDRAEGALEPSLSYYGNVLKGGPAAMEAIAPEVGALQAGAQQTRQAAGQFAPRGGGRASMMGNLPYKVQEGVTNLMSQARREAAAALPEVAQVLTQVGYGRSQLADLQTNLSDLQRRIGATEADIGLAAGQLGLSVGQLQAMLLDVSQRGLGAILSYDIANRDLVFEHAKQAAKAGGDIGVALWDAFKAVFPGLGGGNLISGGGGWSKSGGYAIPDVVGSTMGTGGGNEGFATVQPTYDVSP
jgi:hypothetical protein